uniref:Uncharacterized protein n=1 Tax=Arundo donax TaxID=35708 RepID=A0A0A9ANF6_ARUDO
MILIYFSLFLAMIRFLFMDGGSRT